jgi:hypothetical protein
MPSINFVLNQIQYNATTFQKCKLICQLITKMYFCHLHANDDQFNAKTCPANYSFRSRRFRQAQATHPFAIKQEKENQKCKRKEKEIGSDDLKEPNEKSYRLLMSFTRVPAQSDRREESSGLISSSQQQKTQK